MVLRPTFTIFARRTINLCAMKRPYTPPSLHLPETSHRNRKFALTAIAGCGTLLLLLALRHAWRRKKTQPAQRPKMGIPKQENHKMQQEYDKLLDKQKRLQADYASLEQAHNRTREELDKLQADYACLKKNHDELQEECRRLRQACDDLQQQTGAGGKHPNQKVLDAATATHGKEAASVFPGDDLPWNSSDEFLSQAIRFIRDNMDNANLSIEEFAKQMNISRSMLFRKLKATTGLAPVDFVHRVRITYSIELLRGDYNFSQIAYMTGFNDPKYFTKCFKRYTGMTPSEWKEKRLQKAGKPHKEIFSHNNSYQFGNNLNEDLYL